MQVKIYADVVFFINLFMDFFIFWIVKHLVKKKISFIRLLLGSLLAALLYCLVLFIEVLNRFYNFTGALLILTVAIYFIFRPRSGKELLKLLFFSHVSAFAVGGAGIALFYFTNISSAIGSMFHFSVGNFSFKILIASTASIYIVIKLSAGWINTNIINKKNFCNVRIYFGSESAQVTALIDTGSSLFDPITNAPVIVAEFTAVQKFFPPETRLIFYKEKKIVAENIIECLGEHPMAKKIRLIPFTSLGVENGMLLGFKADKTEVITQDKEDLPISNAVIGIYNHSLCKNKGYNALISTDIFLE